MPLSSKQMREVAATARSTVRKMGYTVGARTRAYNRRKSMIVRKRKNLTRLDPFPYSKIVRMRYTDYITIPGGGVGAPGYYVFSANGLFDPNITGVGHQPMFHDTFQALYNHYVVLGSRIKIQAWGEITTGAYGAVLACKLDDDGSATYNNGRIMEQGKDVKYTILRENALSTHSMGKLSMNFSAKKWFGIKDIKDNKDNLGALFGANPTEQAYYVLHWQHPDNSTTVGTLKCLVNIDFIVQVSEPKDFVQS